MRLRVLDEMKYLFTVLWVFLTGLMVVLFAFDAKDGLLRYGGSELLKGAAMCWSFVGISMAIYWKN